MSEQSPVSVSDLGAAGGGVFREAWKVLSGHGVIYLTVRFTGQFQLWGGTCSHRKPVLCSTRTRNFSAEPEKHYKRQRLSCLLLQKTRDSCWAWVCEERAWIESSGDWKCFLMLSIQHSHKAMITLASYLIQPCLRKLQHAERSRLGQCSYFPLFQKA